MGLYQNIHFDTAPLFLYINMEKQIHPLHQFVYCPICGCPTFVEHNAKAKECTHCGFVYYFNPSSAVACFIRNEKGELLLVQRGKDPGKGTLDLPGGFVDMYESGEEAAAREVKEETGLDIHDCRYLFSIPNIYPYKGFVVHTLDMFFECSVSDFRGAKAADDAADIIVRRPETLSPSEFGLDSIRKAIERVLNEKTLHKK